MPGVQTIIAYGTLFFRNLVLASSNDEKERF